MLHSCLCPPPPPNSIPESIPVWKEKLKRDFAAVQGACSSTLGALGQSCLHQPWCEEPRRSHSRPGQALPSRQISSGCSGCSYLPFPLLPSFQFFHGSSHSPSCPCSGHTLCRSGAIHQAPRCRRAPKAFE